MHSHWFADAVQGLSGHPILQGFLAAFSTFILEDPTTIGCGLLVADGKMSLAAAYWGVSLGIAIGDLGLYFIGRLLGRNVLKWRIIPEDRLQKAHAWFERNLVVAVVVSRFVPGMRIPTFVGSGVFRASWAKFFAIALGASLVWTGLLLTLTIRLGQAVLPMLGELRWPLAIAFLAFFVFAQVGLARRRSRRAALEQAAQPAADPPVSLFEFWPPALFYAPVVAYYLWLAVRFRSLTLPTAANPSIYCGGFVRESKLQILGLIPEPMRHWTPRYIGMTRPSADEPIERAVEQAKQSMESAGLAYPIVAKPDIGQRGAGVRKIGEDAELAAYLAAFPPGHELILQGLIPYDHEAGVFYIRKPSEPKGRIFSITIKTFPAVTGDGRRTLRELILADPRARVIHELYFERHKERLETVLADGDVFKLVFAGNHAQGAVFTDGTRLATAALLDRFEEIARAIPEFYFGRFDVRYRDLDSLLRGEGFQIVEINGAGAEATHIWDAKMTLRGAYRTLFAQFRWLFEIGDENRRRGRRPQGPARLIQDIREGRRIVRDYPPSS